jgi:hypothetical protein
MTGLKPDLEAGRFPGETVVEKDFVLGHSFKKRVALTRKDC